MRLSKPFFFFFFQGSLHERWKWSKFWSYSTYINSSPKANILNKYLQVTLKWSNCISHNHGRDQKSLRKWYTQNVLQWKCGKRKVSSHNVNYVTYHITPLPCECFVSNVTDCAVKCQKYNFNILRTTVSADINIPPVVQFQ